MHTHLSIGTLSLRIVLLATCSIAMAVPSLQLGELLQAKTGVTLEQSTVTAQKMLPRTQHRGSGRISGAA